MVVHLRLRTYKLLYREISNVIAEILSAWEKAECYEDVASTDVASHSQRIFISIQYFLSFSKIHYITHWKIEKLSFWIKVKICI